MFWEQKKTASFCRISFETACEARAIPVSISIHPELKTKLLRPLQRGFAPFAMHRIMVGIAVLAWDAGVIGCRWAKPLLTSRHPPRLTHYNYSEEGFYNHHALYTTLHSQDYAFIL